MLNHLQRHLDLSDMFKKMGLSLINEGTENNDYKITQSGNFFILLSELILDERNFYILGELSTIMLSKIMCENIGDTSDEYLKYLKDKKQDETFINYIRRTSK